MKSLKQLIKNANSDSQSDSKSDQQSKGESQLVESSAQQQQVSESQYRSSDYVSITSQLIHDEELGYGVGQYTMEKIIQRRWNLTQKRFEYLLKWKGFSIKECTWQTTQDILREPCLKLKDLGKNTMLPIFERTHGKTIIWDEIKGKNVGEYIHSERNHLLYSPKELIEEMQRQMEEHYGQKEKYEKIKSQANFQSQVKIQPQTIPLKPKQSQNSMTDEFFEGFTADNIEVGKLVFCPLEMEIKITVRLISNPDVVRLITCSQMMKINPKVALMCQKIKLAYMQQWLGEQMPKLNNKEFLKPKMHT